MWYLWGNKVNIVCEEWMYIRAPQSFSEEPMLFINSRKKLQGDSITVHYINLLQ